MYNANGRNIGVVVSRSCRGATDDAPADPGKCFFLHRDPDTSRFDCPWVMPRNIFRVSQGRGVSPLASSLGTILDLESLCDFELAAAKKNSQTIATVLQSSSPSNEDAVEPSPFDSGMDFSGMSDEEIEKAVKELTQANEQTVTLDRVQSAGVIYQVLPENVKMELLDTKHPNANMPAFIKFMATKSFAPFGLSEQFATFAPTGADFRANQLFSSRAFQEAQTWLERQVCDWTLVQVARFWQREGRLGDLPENWINRVKWAWPRMDELDELSHQNAVALKLKNGTGTYADELGPDWREKLERMAEEVAWFKQHNLAHPSFDMISGGERTGADVMPAEDPAE